MARNNDNIEPRRDVISTKNLSNQTLSAIPDNRSTQSLRRGNAEPSDGQSVRFREQRVIAARNAGPMLVDVLEIGVSADPLAWAELQTAYSLLTVRRLRPFARRRFNTRRPFFVLIRTRNPCARLRRRVFGWNVRLPFIRSSLRPRLPVYEPAIVANGFKQCQCE